MCAGTRHMVASILIEVAGRAIKATSSSSIASDVSDTNVSVRVTRAMDCGGSRSLQAGSELTTPWRMDRRDTIEAAHCDWGRSAETSWRRALRLECSCCARDTVTLTLGVSLKASASAASTYAAQIISRADHMSSIMLQGQSSRLRSEQTG
jgi:hypothetical protein